MKWIVTSSLAVAMSLASAGISHAGGGVTFSADMYGMNMDGTSADPGVGEYAIFDIYCWSNSTDIRLLSVFNMDISLSSGVFIHHDGSVSGQWSATTSSSTFGGKAWVDSFVTMGAVLDQDPFVTQLDPNFDNDASTMVSSSAGWYNNSPSNGQGDFDGANQILIGRFVINGLNGASDGVELSVSGDMSYNYGSPGVYFDNDSGVFTMPSTTIPIPGPMGMAALVASGLVRRNRRR